MPHALPLALLADLVPDKTALLTLLLQLLLAIVCSFLIGFERELKNRPAGLRTHMIVCIAAMLVMAVGTRVAAELAEQGRSADPSRLAAQVVSGIGFLGAGTILKGKNTVHGLTTAATLWAVACVGIAIGAGYWLEGAMATLAVLITLRLAQFIERRVIAHNVILAFNLRLLGPVNNLRLVRQILQGHGIRVSSDRLCALSKRGDETLIEAMIEVHRTRRQTSLRQDIPQLLLKFDFILECKPAGEREPDASDFSEEELINPS